MNEHIADRLRRHSHDLVNGGTNASGLRSDLAIASDLIDVYEVNAVLQRTVNDQARRLVELQDAQRPRPYGSAPGWDLVTHLDRQRAFSERTFGPGHRTKGIIDHIVKELREIDASPLDLTEWVDVILLALDGAWRAGHSSRQIAWAIHTKQDINEARTWPDWRTAAPDQAITHHRFEFVHDHVVVIEHVKAEP